jgi:hypothetical protein
LFYRISTTKKFLEGQGGRGTCFDEASSAIDPFDTGHDRAGKHLHDNATKFALEAHALRDPARDDTPLDLLAGLSGKFDGQISENVFAATRKRSLCRRGYSGRRPRAKTTLAGFLFRECGIVVEVFL